MRRKTNEQPLGEVIKDMLKAYRLENKLREVEIRSVWEDVMGKAVANRTKKIELKKGKLSIYLTSAVLRQELNYNKPKIAELINKKIGETVVQEVEVR